MRFTPLLNALIVVLFLAPSSAYAGSLFQTGVPGSHGFAYFPFWQQVLNDMAAPEQPSIAHADAAHVPQCAALRRCVPAVWTSFLDSIRKEPRHAQLNAVNQWANAKPYIEDIANWHVADYWATPGEFIARGGDCEDYAITKYFSLVRLGFSPDDLRIVIVNDVNLNAFHAVLAVRDDGTTWLLDNQLQQVVAMDLAVQYQPIYSLNEHGWWLHTMPKISLGNVTIAAGGNNTEVEIVH